MKTRVKYETANRYEYIQYALQSVLKLCYIYIEEVDIIGLHLQQFLKLFREMLRSQYGRCRWEEHS